MSLAPTDLFPAYLRLSTRLVSELGAQNSTLRAAVQGTGSAVIVYAGGEVDACNEDTWRLLLREASAFVDPQHPFLVDINSVDFMSCSGWEALADQAHRCRERGIDLCLISLQPSVGRMVEACGLGDVLTVHPSAAQALDLYEPACPEVEIGEAC
ncbi:anti-sigma factor antagonist [Mycobacterium sp. 1423905.2]|uniref:anti-sigma factor antagonist n=1 Tax=Mycobacterium sp. 1423905.2 TaxID=1856859 RepID=UPI0007FEB575|nr:anti-sigma factor antagonist [Mycobacterium sp. 1423905.2]OBJ53107.1 hypothetical protein A9W95_18860 [Mycobacterium sp. 1423905.2]